MLLETTWEFLLGVFQEASPLGVPPDLQSGVKRCPNLLMLCGFAIRSKGVCINLDKKKGSSQILVQSPNFYMKEQYF